MKTPWIDRFARGEYVVSSTMLNHLDRIRRLLYAPEALHPDDRRDAANLLQTLLDQGIEGRLPE